MKLWLSNVLYFVLVPFIYAQNTDAKKDNDGVDAQVHLELIIETDTLTLGEPSYLFLNIMNGTKKPIYVPREIDLISDLYPNGVDGPFDGAVVKLQFDPAPEGAMHIENNIVVSEINEFVKIRPNSSVKFSLVDLSEYIVKFNADMDSADLEIRQGVPYKLKAYYQNSYRKKGKEDRSYTGIAFSQDITVYIK